MLQGQNSAHAWRKLSRNYTHPRRFWHVFQWGEWYPRENLAPVEPESYVEICPTRKSQLKTSPLVEEAGRENFRWERLARILIQDQVQNQVLIPGISYWAWISSEKPPSWPSQETSSVTRRLRLISGQFLLVSQRLIYPWKETNIAIVLKLLFAAVEIIRRRDQGKGIFFSKLNHFYNEFIKDNWNRPTPILGKFNDYLYRWAETVWPRTLDEVQKQSRKKYLSISVLLSKIKLCWDTICHLKIILFTHLVKCNTLVVNLCNYYS